MYDTTRVRIEYLVELRDIQPNPTNSLNNVDDDDDIDRFVDAIDDNDDNQTTNKALVNVGSDGKLQVKCHPVFISYIKQNRPIFLFVGLVSIGLFVVGRSDCEE